MYLHRRFNLQSNYVSANDDRWVLRDHYYKYTLTGAGDGNATTVSVDVFNVDTNFADVHGAQEICCQCYGYATTTATATAAGDDNTCAQVARGDPLCAGGDVALFDRCLAVLLGWWDDSLAGLAADLAASQATYRVVNSHYSPLFHMAPAKQQAWMDLLAKHSVHLFLNGHTHGENHDFATTGGTHFVQNGAGGGIQSEAGAAATTAGVEK